MTTPRRYDLIAFDWDGTLFDSTALIVRCIQAACRDLGVAVPDDGRAAHVIGLGLRDALAYAVPNLPVERYAELGGRYRHHYVANQDEVVLFDGVLPMLRELKAHGHRLAVATGKSRRGLDEALDGAQLRSLFDATRTAEQTRSKPHPLMLDELIGELNVSAARTLMIGDTSHDLQLARNAGVDGVAVGYGAHGPDELLPYAPLFVARSVAELHEWLRRHG